MWITRRRMNGAVASLVVLGQLAACARVEQVHRYYATYGELTPGVRAAAWFPTWPPPEATDIHLQDDVSTKKYWIRFRLPPQHADTLKKGLLGIPPAQYATVTSTQPSGAAWWFDGLVDRHPADDGALSADVFQGASPAHGSAPLVAFDRTSDRVFVWGVGP